MSEYLDVMNRSTRDLSNISEELAGLARAFYRTGNEAAAKELTQLSYEISETYRNIDRAVGKEINRQ